MPIVQMNFSFIHDWTRTILRFTITQFDTYDSIRIYKVLETCDPSSFPTLIANVNPPRAVRILLVCIFCVIPGTLFREERSFLHDILDKQLTKRY